MRRALVMAALLGLLGLMSSPAIAQAPPPHDHFLTVPGTGEQVQVAPHRCELGATVQNGFVQFHVNVHTGQPTATGVVVITLRLC
jgi:hypothetical protein